MVGLVDVQDKGQVKSSLENKEVEYNCKCYCDKDMERCGWLVDYLEEIQKNFDETSKVLKSSSEDNKHIDSCYKPGAYYVPQKGRLTQDLKAALS